MSASQRFNQIWHPDHDRLRRLSSQPQARPAGWRDRGARRPHGPAPSQPGNLDARHARNLDLLQQHPIEPCAPECCSGGSRWPFVWAGARSVRSPRSSAARSSAKASASASPGSSWIVAPNKPSSSTLPLRRYSSSFPGWPSTLGGSTPIGCLGYAVCAQEIVAQEDAAGGFARIVLRRLRMGGIGDLLNRTISAMLKPSTARTCGG